MVGTLHSGKAEKLKSEIYLGGKNEKVKSILRSGAGAGAGPRGVPRAARAWARA